MSASDTILTLPPADYRRLLDAEVALGVLQGVDLTDPHRPVPVVAAFDDGPGHVCLRWWCIHCRQWHLHGRGGPEAPHQLGQDGAGGHRITHCVVRNSPYRRCGVILDVMSLSAAAPQHRARKENLCPRCRRYFSAAYRRCGCGHTASKGPGRYPELAALYLALIGQSRKRW